MNNTAQSSRISLWNTKRVQFYLTTSRRRATIVFLFLHFITFQLKIISANEINWTSLEDSLVDSSLYGPVQGSEYASCSTYTDPYSLMNGENGICMQTLDCGFKFCDPKRYGSNLPSYTLDAKSEEDIISAVNFASSNNIEITVKTSGSSLQGSSTKGNSLLIRMSNFPKDGEIKNDYSDGCGNRNDVVGIGGGETWKDVLDAVKEDYTIVSPNEKSLGAAGGWLQGGGIAYNSRLYGLGVDNVVDFRVILMDGSVVTANECTNPDLFWSLRGGGGGTFGIVTHIHYKLHEPTQIVQFNFKVWGKDNLREKDKRYYGIVINQWLSYFLQESVSLDKRWCGGHFGHDYGHILFCGSTAQAKLTFLNDFVYWEKNVLLKTGMRPGIGGWGSLYATTTYRNWYEYTCGGVLTGLNHDAFSVSELTSTFPADGMIHTFVDSKAFNPGKNISSRIMPLNRVLTNQFGVIEMLLDQKVIDSSFGMSNYFLGGQINEVSGAATSVHPSMRTSIFTIYTNGDKASNLVRDFIPNSITGVEYNHHNVIEPEWRNACWGSNYEKLVESKLRYDPQKLLNCWHCVLYTGYEIPERATLSPTATHSTMPSTTPSDVESASPSKLASDRPSSSPSTLPSLIPSAYPTSVPSTSPSIGFSSAPSSMPSITLSPSLPEKEDPSAEFVLKDDSTRKCTWLAKKPSDVKRRICSKKRYQRSSESKQLGPASLTCYDTCAPYCVEEAENAKFVLEKVNDQGKEMIVTKQCQWLAARKQEIIEEICGKSVDYSGFVYGQAFQMCTTQCKTCTTFEEIRQ